MRELAAEHRKLLEDELSDLEKLTVEDFPDSVVAFENWLGRAQTAVDRAGELHTSVAAIKKEARSHLDGPSLEELTRRADAGDADSARRLADRLASEGDEPRLRARVRAGDETAAARLLDVLRRKGNRRLADRIEWAGLTEDGSVAEVPEPGPDSSSARRSPTTVRRYDGTQLSVRVGTDGLPVRELWAMHYAMGTRG
ncbi:hypothetical protein ACPPVO_03375 [Dactylosporangium sp. McL0621]|uniref:hypothetical protein n=1 Tax=Dactylosporangium sp. McL0621 TaxID=3415678 RepID=UPI003CE72CF4